MKRAPRIRDQKCNIVRHYILEAFENSQVTSLNDVAMIITERCADLRGFEDAHVCTLIMCADSFEYNSILKEYSNLYYEFDIYQRLKCIVTIKHA